MGMTPDKRHKNKGRPTFGEKALSDEEIRERYAQKLRAEGGRALSMRLKDARHAQILRKFANESKMNFKSETAAATYLIEKALDNVARRMNYQEEKAPSSEDPK